MTPENSRRWQLELIATCAKLEARDTAVVLRAVFGWRYVDTSETFMEAINGADELPAAGRTCIITAGGEVLTHWVDPKDSSWAIINLGDVEHFRDGMRRLADTAKLDDADRVAFFDDLRKWVKDDHRPEAATDWLGMSKQLDHS